jgi:hypothetical protein
MILLQVTNIHILFLIILYYLLDLFYIYMLFHNLMHMIDNFDNYMLQHFVQMPKII